MNEENLSVYNLLREVPQEARKPITSGRLKGMTDINPMWRIKRLTEVFGPFGWKTELADIKFIPGANNEVTCMVTISLYVKRGDEWQGPIPGIGGAKYVAKEQNGMHTDDDAPKKAYTDAISVAGKHLGLGADVYFEKDRDDKYPTDAAPQSPPPPQQYQQPVPGYYPPPPQYPPQPQYPQTQQNYPQRRQ